MKSKESLSQVAYDISILYELSLAVGKSLDLEKNCDHFIKTLRARKNLGYASVWIRGEYLVDVEERHLLLERFKSMALLVYANPKFRIRETSLPLHHPVFSMLDGREFFSISSSEKDFSKMITERGIDRGTYAIFSLGKFGFLKLFSISREMPFQEEELNQLKNVISKFVISLEGCIFHQKVTWEISERLRAEEALQISEKKYRELADLLPEIVYEADINGNLLFANQRAFDTFGYTKEEFNKGINVLEMVIPEDRGNVIQNLQRLLKGEKGAGNEYMALRKDGSTFPVFASANLIVHDNNPVGMRGVVIDITERKRAEETLRESEEKYRTILENIEDAYYEVDLAGNLTLFNDSFCRLVGYSKDELMGMNHRQLTDSENGKKLYQDFNKVFRTRESSKVFDWEIINKDGTKRNAEASVSLIKDPGGHPVGFRGIIRDVTERKRGEEALRSERDKFRGMLLAINDGVDIVNKDYIIEFQNEILRERFGDKAGEKCYAAYMGLEEPCHFCSIQEAIKTGSATGLELVGKDGRNYELNSSPFTDVDGIVKVIELVRDITERKRAEEVLKESEEKYRTILENIEDGYFEVDIAGNFTFFNDSVCRILGYSKDELMGMSSQQYTDQENAKKLYEAFNKVFKTGEPTKGFIWEIIRKDGTKRVTEASVSLIRDSKGQPIGFRGIARDITDRKQAEEALLKSEEWLRLLIQNIQAAIIVHSADTKIVTSNVKAQELLGLTEDQMFGKTSIDPAWKFFREDGSLMAPEEYPVNQVLATQQPLKDLVGGIYRPNKSDIVWVLLNAVPVFEQNGKINQVIVAFVDITERKRAEEALRESEERYRTILENIEDGYYEVDLPGNFTFFNDSLCRMLGYSKDEMIGMGNQQYTDQENRKKLLQAFNDVYRTGGAVKGFDWEVIRKDGAKLFGEVSVSLIKNSKEQPIGFRGIARDITERKRAEEVLRKSEEEFRLTFENAKDAIVWADPEAGVITKCNKEAETLWEKKREEIIGNHQTTLHPPQKAEYYINMFKKHIEHKGVADDEAEIITKSGKIKPVNITASLTLVGGKPIIQGIFRDITERKQAEETLHNEKQRFQTLSEQAPFGMVMIDQNSTFRYMNPKFKELFGYDLTDVPDGRTWFRKAYPDPTYRHHVIGTWIKDLESFKPEEKRSEVFTVTCKDGTKKIINFIPVQLETGENLMACEDITERKEAEESLKKSEVRFQELFNDAPVGYFEYDVGGRIIDANRTELEMLGYTFEEMIGQPVWKFIAEEEVARKQILEKLAGTIPPARGVERVYQRKDGTTLPVLIEDRIIRDSEGRIKGIRTTIQDISELKRAEQEMRTLEEQLLQSQKMEAVGRLAGGIAHDFNNLLTVIKGYSQLSLLDLTESDPLWGNIQEVQKATQRASDLTRQLLAFSRRQILDLKVLNLNILLKDLDKMLRRIIGEDIELVTLLAEELGRVKIDPGQFEQMILNLAVNARDAMLSGGKLTIETANVELDKEYTRTHIGVKPGSYVRLSVSDTGIGIPIDIKEKVFEPFFTTKEKGKGTGLGLSTVYGIVKQSEGSIWVYSEKGHGTTFKIYLPKVEEELDTVLKQEESDAFPKGNETVLLVEDDPLVRDLTHRLLSQQGYTVLEAANGKEALRVAQKNIAEKIHLLLTDVVMPLMGGKELSEKLKLLRPDIKVLYTSGYTDDAIVHHGVLQPGTHFLQKPFSHKTLSDKVREVLDQ